MKTKVLYKKENKELLRRAARETRCNVVNTKGNKADVIHPTEYELEAFTEVYEDFTNDTLIIESND